MNVSTKPVVKGKRPLGVWILTGYALLLVGLVPIAIAVVLYASGEAQAAGVDTLDLLLPLVLGICATIAAIGAWRGNNKARIALVVLVTIHYVLIAINNLLMLSSGALPESQQISSWGRVFRGVLYPAVYFWYFRRAKTKEYYERVERV